MLTGAFTAETAGAGRHAVLALVMAAVTQALSFRFCAHRATSRSRSGGRSDTLAIRVKREAICE
ncbi:MAG: hypothetical protein ABW047_02950 [Nitrospiraceae bacterium]